MFSGPGRFSGPEWLDKFEILEDGVLGVVGVKFIRHPKCIKTAGLFTA